MNKHNRGAAMFELVVAIGTLATFMFVGVDLASMANKSKTMAMLSREAGNTVKRECGGTDVENTQLCVNRTIANLLAAADVASPGFSSDGGIRITIWTDPDPPDPRFADPVNSDQGTDYPGDEEPPIICEVGAIPAPTSYVNMTMDDDFVKIFNSQLNVVVSEVYYSYEPLIPLLPVFRGQAYGSREVLYETAVF